MAGVATRGPVAGAREVPDALAPPPRHPRFPALDGLRAVAALLVLAYHATFYSRAYEQQGGRLLAHLNLGVTVFFLISGFLLFRPFIAYRAGGPGRPAVPRYFRRRFLRIFPAYWLLLIGLTLLPRMSAVGDDWLASFALLDPLPILHKQGCAANPFGCGAAHTWSLTVELTFYLALPAYALATAWLVARSRRPWVAIELALLAALAVASVIAGYVAAAPTVVANSLAAYMLWFGLGMGLAVASVATEGRALRLFRSGWLSWAAAAVAYIGVCYALPPTPLLLSRHDLLVQHLGFALVALLIMAPLVLGSSSGGAQLAMRTRTVAWLGLVSYGIFLWHNAIVLRLSHEFEWSFVPLMLATVALTVPIAALSYYLVERPILRWKH